MAISSMQLHLKPVQGDPRALKILAKSIYKELRAQGYDAKQVVSLATDLISFVTTELEKPSSR